MPHNAPFPRKQFWPILVWDDVTGDYGGFDTAERARREIKTCRNDDYYHMYEDATRILCMKLIALILLATYLCLGA